MSKRFPDIKCLRLDSDIAAKRGAYEQVLSQFSRGEAQTLIGTQMVSKGLDIPNVTVVGVLAADSAFNLPDYRSMERGFQLLTQVSGRAGRGQRPGLVVLQTYNAEMPALAWARAHNYGKFFEEEIAARSALSYPPFCQLIRIVVAGPDAAETEAACEQVAEELTNFIEDQLPPDGLSILGPAPCLIERLRGNFRFHLLIKNFVGDTGRGLVALFFRKKQLKGLQLAIDVDALDTL